MRVLTKLTNFYSLGYVKRPLNCNSTAQTPLSEVESEVRHPEVYEMQVQQTEASTMKLHLIATLE